MAEKDNIQLIDEAVERLRRLRAAGKATPNDAITLAKESELPLAAIAAAYGADSTEMLQASTPVADEMLNTIIAVINHPGGDIKRTLTQAARALVYIDALPRTEEFDTRRYRPQREKIDMLMARHRIRANTFGIDYRPTVDDDACYAACATPDDYTRYMHRHPEGKHFAEARAHVDKAQRKADSRKRLRLTALRIATSAVALVFIAALCHALDMGGTYTAGILMVSGAALLAYLFIKAGGDNPARRKALTTGGLLTAVALTAAAIIMVYTEGERRQRQALDEILATHDEDALVAYLCDPANTAYADEAFEAYLAMMDSVFFDPAQMEKPSQAPPLTRMESLARSEDLPERMRKALNERMKVRTDSLYRIALADGSIEAWEKFQSLAPGEFYYDSSEKIDSLDEVVWSSEASAWQRAAAINTRDAYIRYIDTYPSGAHAAKANARIVDFEVKDYRNQGQIIVESIDRITDYDGPGSKVSIYNDSDVPITFLFSGPSSGRLSIPPHSQAETDIADGEYQVLAQVSNARRDRFSFTQKFSHGYYSSTISLNTNE